MPRFLAIDYLGEAVNHRRTALNRMLVTSPQHLECVDSYPHKGLLEDYKFRLPWQRAKCDTNFDGLIAAENVFKELAWMKDQYQSDELQKYSDTSIVPDVKVGTVDVVLSSNPDSPPPTKEDILDDMAIGKQGQGLAEKEIFHKEELELFSVEEGKSPFLLENIEEVDNLSEFMNHLPQLTDLMGRLKPKAVQDPFVDKEGNLISEMLIIRDHAFDISEVCPMVENPDVKEEHSLVNENFDRDFLLDVLEDPIEEELSLFMKEPREGNDESVRVLESLSPSVNLEPIIIEDDEEAQQVQGMNSLSKELDARQGQPYLETVDMSPTDPTNCADFTTMNSEGVDDDCQEKMLLLESPIDGQRTLEVKVETVRVKDLVPFEESPVLGHQYVLSPSNRGELERKLWIAEKYFSDVLTLARLPEPVDPRKRKELINVIADAKEVLSVRQDSGLADDELNLNWDPISASEQQMRMFSKVEMITYSTSDCFKLKEWKMLYAKYDRSYFIDWKDELIPCKMQVAPYQAQNGKGMVSIIPSVVAVSEVSHQTSASLKQTNTSVRTLKLKERAGNPVQGDPSNLKRLRLLDNPLDNFLLMRGVGKSSEGPGLSTSIPEPRTPMVKKLQRTQVNTSSTPLTPTTPTRDPKKPKTKSIEVKLTDDFSAIIHAIHLHAEPHLTVLKLRNLIPASHRLDSLTPDVTRFMLKQHEKTLQDKQDDDQYNDTYTAVVVLHALVTATDYLVHCCLQSAIATLSAMQEKHKSILGDLLSALRQQLFKSQCRFQQGKVLHPKVAAVCSNVAHWYKRKKQVSFDQDPKILVILRRDLPSLRDCICEALSEVEDFQPFSIKRLPTHQDVVDSLDHHNCIIVSCDQIGSDFQWAQFSLVVEYEQTDDLTLKELCQRQHIRYLSLKAVKGVVMTVTCPEKGLEKPEVPQHQFTFIGSEMVTANTDLLHCLEAKCNITIIERMYSKVSPGTGRRSHHADLLVDERTCIVLQNVSNLVEVHQMEPLVEKIIALSLKYEKCWVIVFSAPTEKEKTKYSFAGSVCDNLCKLYGTLSQVSSDQLSVQVNLVNSISGLAKMIRQIGDVSLKATSVWGEQDWVDRTWLTEQMSEHEKFLLSLPWFNTLSAQILLTADTLSHLMMLSLNELIEKVPWLPEKVLKSFHNFSHRRCGIALPPYTPPVMCTTLEEGKQVETTGYQADQRGSTLGFEGNQQDAGTADARVKDKCEETSESDQSMAEIVSRSPLDFIVNGYGARSSNYVPSKDHGSDRLFSVDGTVHDVPVHGGLDVPLPKRPKLFTEFSEKRQSQSSLGNRTMPNSDTQGRVNAASGQGRSHLKRLEAHGYETAGFDEYGHAQKKYGHTKDDVLHQDSMGAGYGLRQFVKPRSLDQNDGQEENSCRPDGDRFCEGGRNQGIGKDTRMSGSLHSDSSWSHLKFDDGRESKKAHPVTNGAYSVYSATNSEDCRSDVEPRRSYADGPVEQLRAKKTVYQTSGRSVADMIDEVRQSREKTSWKGNNVGSILHEREGLLHLPSDHQLSRTSQSSDYLGVPERYQVSQPRSAQQKSVEHLPAFGVPLPLSQKQVQSLGDVFSSKHRPVSCSFVGHCGNENTNSDPMKRVTFIKQEPIDVESPHASDGRDTMQRDQSTVLSHTCRPGLYPLCRAVDQPSYTTSSIQMPHSVNTFEHYSDRQRDSNRGTEVGYSVERFKHTAPTAISHATASAEMNPTIQSSESYSNHRTEMAFTTAHCTTRSRHSIANPVRRIPGVAPVTPTVRRPLQALSLEIGGGGGTIQDRQEVEENTCLNHSYDSPPMDLDSDEENCSSFYHSNQSNLPGQRVVMTPQVRLRKRRLIYEKVPGAKDGQTRLTFI